MPYLCGVSQTPKILNFLRGWRMIYVFCWCIGYGKSGYVLSFVKLILINICIQYLWHIKTILLPPNQGAILLWTLSDWEYMVLPYLGVQYLVLPYMVLCNVYKQYIVCLESFVSKNVVIWLKIYTVRCVMEVEKVWKVLC